jgi:NedA-like, galactose-binding domain/Disaggregatase related/Protein of unknown function (DUF1565)
MQGGMRYANAAKAHPTFSSILAAIAVVALLLTTAVSAGRPWVSITTTSPSDGQTVSGSVSWTASVTNGSASRVDFLIDGVLKWTETIAPYVYNGDGNTLDTRTLSDSFHTLTVTAYSSKGGPDSHSIYVRVANNPVTPTGPTNTAAPTLSGIGGQGQTLTVAAGTWTGLPTSYAYQWRRCDASTGSCADVAGATGTSYRLGLTDIGAKLKAVVTATNAGGSASASSALSGVVRPDKAMGRTTSASSSESTSLVPEMGNDGSSASRWSSSWTDGQWWRVDLGSVRRVDTVSLNWEYAWASSYKIQLSSDGTTFTDAATVSNTAAGWKSTTFAAVDARYVRVLGVTRATTYGISFWDAQVFGPDDASAPPPPTVVAPASVTAPTISGTAKVGQTLAASAGTWSNSPTSYTYSWQRCGTSCAAVGSQSSYAVTSADLGQTLKVGVTASNTAGSATATSAPTAAVTADPPPPTDPAAGLGSKLPARIAQSTGQNYYVATTGSDSNSGTITSPWRTIAKALATVPTTGSIINVRVGSYSGQNTITNRTGSATNPLTIQAYPGENVVLTGPAAQLPTFYVSRVTGLRIKGFEISDPTGMSGGIQIENSKDIEVVGNEIHTGGHQGVLVAGTGTTVPAYSENVQLWSNTFYGNGGYWASSNSFWIVGDHSVYYGGSSSSSDGLRHGTVGGVIADNLFYDQPYGFHLQIGSQNDGLIVTNNTFDNDFQADSRVGNAVQLWNEGSYGTHNVTVVNNIITWNKQYGVHGSGSTQLSNLVRNNLCYGNARGSYEPIYGSSTLFTLGTNLPDANPLYANRAGHDFHLTAGSPANGKSDPAYTPPYDFDGKARGAAPDLGAFEYTG